MSEESSTSFQVFNTALQMLETLLDEEKGCPWLSSRKFEELFPYYLEELHEYRQAFEAQGLEGKDTQQELADLLFQWLLHSKKMELANKGKVRAQDLAQAVCDKLERRHPHVFDPDHPKFANAEEAGKAWEELKKQDAQKANRSAEVNESRAEKLERIPQELPALQRAARIGEKTHSFGFDWQNSEEVFAKVSEEFQELKEAKNSKEREEELGDLFFSLAQLARHWGFCPEYTAFRANEKFLKRFRSMQELPEAQEWEKLSPDERESLWRKAKAKEKALL